VDIRNVGVRKSVHSLSFPPPAHSAAAEELRAEVRAFLRVQLASRTPRQRSDSWNGFSAEFSRALGARGWLGMTWPKKYGGGERSALERYVVVEELLAAGAPVAAHWIADRQTGPLILKFGNEDQKRSILPRIARGECYTCIGMSEPDVGSDLASVRTRAVRVEDGYRVNGTKVWITNAHHAHFMALFCRTSGTPDDRHKGTSQLLVDLSLPGITIRPIIDLAGQHHFNEVSFQDAMVPATALLGQEGDGWQQVTSELSYERSGPDRFLSSFTLLNELTLALKGTRSEAGTRALGRLIAHVAVLRRLSRSVATLLDQGAEPLVHASIVKDLGATLEQEIPEIARLLVDSAPDDPATAQFFGVLANTMLNAPTFSLRGGTREILRGIIARGLGLR
jgi:alkylation response protein AidB-like acyl-CoA dehydrogenase